jgi:AsmA protein
MKTVKTLLIAFGVLLVLGGGLLAYIAATFDPNAYKPQIIQLVQQHTQRTLRLDGDIKLALWPGIGADLGRLSLSERNSEKPFVAVEAARFSLKLLPLLSKQLVVDEVTVRGARINLARGKDGRMNFDDLLGVAPASPGKAGRQKPQPPAAGGSQQFAFDIDRVVIADSMLEFRDEAAGARYAVSKLNLKTGRIASGVPADIDLSLVVQGDRPKLDLAVGLKTRLAFDAQQKAGTLEQLALEVRGQAADVNKLDLRAGGSVRVNSGGGEFAAEKLAVTATGMQGKDAFDVKLDVPAVTGSMQAFKAGAVTVDAGLKQGERAIRLRLTSPVNGNLQAQQFSLPQLKAGISATGPDVPGKSISGDLAGSASTDIGKQNVQLNLSGKLAGSAIKARLGVAGFGPSAFSFDVDLDQLDVDRFMPAAAPAGKGGGAPPAAAKSAAAPAQPFDLSALKTLRADGSIRIGALTAGNLKLQNVRAGFKAAGGRVTVNPLAAGLYQGTLNGSAAVDAAPRVPVFAVKQTLTGVSIAPLLKDLANNETLEGKGTVSVDVTARGNTADALKRALDGTAALRVTDGALKGIDIGGAIRNAKARLGALKGEQTQQADAQQKTDFSELTATFNIANGVARNKDLSMKSPLLRIGGEGEINIGADTINYLVKASVVGTAKGQGGRDVDELRGITVPVRVTGPLKAPSYKLDFGAMITDTARQKVEDAVKSRLQDRLLGGGAKPGTDTPPKDGTKSGGGARDVLKGLLGR